MSYSIPHILQGYANGFFLMADEAQPGLEWYTSKQRAMIPLDHRFRYPKSLQRALNQNRFQTAIDRDFAAVVDGCADRASTWISPDLKEVYFRLHRAGWAHSYETWQDGQLAGGILGIVLGGAFIGESMFFRIPEGSKVAMVKLVEHLRSRQFLLFDAQIMNGHLARFGAYTLEPAAYLHQLDLALARDCRFV